MTIALGGKLTRLSAPGSPAPNVQGAVRGDVQHFTRASRRRLLALFNSINRERLSNMPLFITLTYPAEWDPDPASWKRHLDTLLKRWSRRYPHGSAIWRLEFQERQAPHFHVLLFGVPFVPYGTLAGDWYKCVGSGDTRHLSAGTEVRVCQSWEHATHYVAKYLGKVSKGYPGGKVGRWWGVWQRASLPVQLLVCAMDWKSFCRVRRSIYHLSDEFNIPGGRKLRYTGTQRFFNTDTAARLLEYAMSLGASLQIGEQEKGGEVCTEG